MDLLKQLKEANAKRCIEVFKHSVEDWSAPEWACAVAGETGEMCNLIKKMLRGDAMDRDGITPITPGLIGDEAADIVIYLDCLCQKLKIDLRTAIVDKFNKTSEKFKSTETIY